jgi:hypothetical protein
MKTLALYRPDSLTFETVESFSDPADSALPPGEYNRLPLNPNYNTHYVWISTGPYEIQASTILFWVLGELRFYKKGTQVGRLFFEDGNNAGVAATPGANGPAERLLMQDRPGGVGIPQLSILGVNLDSTFYRKELVMPCYRLKVEADEVRYVITNSKISLIAGAILMKTGMRILSAYEV